MTVGMKVGAADPGRPQANHDLTFSGGGIRALSDDDLPLADQP
jgi:hypothetical protein